MAYIMVKSLPATVLGVECPYLENVVIIAEAGKKTEIFLTLWWLTLWWRNKKPQ